MARLDTTLVRGLLATGILACQLSGCSNPRLPLQDLGAGAQGIRYSLLDTPTNPEAAYQTIATTGVFGPNYNNINSNEIRSLRMSRQQSATQSYKTLSTSNTSTSAPKLVGYFTDKTVSGCFQNTSGATSGQQGYALGQCLASTLGHGQAASKYSLLSTAPPGLTKVTNPIRSMPFGDGEGHVFWLSQGGEIYHYDQGSPVAPTADFQILDSNGNPDSFTGTFNLNGYSTGYSGSDVLGIAASDNGNVYTMHLTIGSTTLPYGTTTEIASLGAPMVGQSMPAPWFDNAESNGTYAVFYAISSTTLYRYEVNWHTGALIPGTTRSTLIPMAPPPNYAAVPTTSAVVWNGRLVFGATDIRLGGAGPVHYGQIYCFDLHHWLAGGTLSSTDQLISPVLTGPSVTAVPTFDVNGAANMVYIFEPVGPMVYFVDLVTQKAHSTPALVLNTGDPGPSGNVASLPGGTTNDAGYGGDIQDWADVFYGPNKGDVYGVAVANSNAVWKICAPSSSDNGFYIAYDLTSSTQRDTNFQNLNTMWYSETYLGRNYGTQESDGTYVSNPCQLTEIFNGQDILFYLMDNFGNPGDSTQTSIQRFVTNVSTATLPATPDPLVPPEPLTLAAPSDQPTQMAGLYIVPASFNFAYTGDMIFNTSSNWNNTTSPSAALWSWTP